MVLGKTTTIKIILGLQKMTSGTVKINGFDIKKDFTKAIEKVGSIVESPDTYTYLSGYQNLKQVANQYKHIKKDRINEVVKLVGLEKRIKDKVSKYSLGMKQRLGIAIALLNNPNLLILDEPTNGLDPEGIHEFRELLVKLAREENMAILISSHNLAELETFCTRICIIQNGEIIEENALDMIKNSNIKRSYIFEVENIDSIIDILKNNYKDIEIINKEKFKITIDRTDVSNILKLLENNSIKVYEIKKEDISLEKAFLEKTRGNIID